MPTKCPPPMTYGWRSPGAQTEFFVIFALIIVMFGWLLSNVRERTITLMRRKRDWEE